MENGPEIFIVGGFMGEYRSGRKDRLGGSYYTIVKRLTWFERLWRDLEAVNRATGAQSNQTTLLLYPFCCTCGSAQKSRSVLPQ